MSSSGRKLFKSVISASLKAPFRGVKLRPIDDGAEACIDDLLTVTNKLTLMDVDAFCAMTRAVMDALACGQFSFRTAEGESSMRKWLGRRLDLKSAYKQLPIKPDEAKFAVVM
eukprot:6272166-Amphidinium_carterae.1